jgi:5'(3')-deoxyribonucleotidase
MHIHEQKSPPPQGDIYCDMDGVLVDIIGGICKMDLMTRCNQKSFDKYLEANKKRFDADHPHLFRNLPWMRDGKRLWKYISNFRPHILSAHTNSWQPTSKDDKMVWIKNHLTPLPYKIHILRREEKKNYATKGDGIPNVLIDDWDKNINEWKAAGGIGILHRNAESTIATLRNLGYTVSMKKPK